MTLLNSRVIRIVSASVLGGILIGLIGGAFRYLLIMSDVLRSNLITWAHGRPYVGWLLPLSALPGRGWLVCSS
jgi:CIC family chloride channel protein